MVNLLVEPPCDDRIVPSALKEVIRIPRAVPASILAL